MKVIASEKYIPKVAIYNNNNNIDNKDNDDNIKPTQFQFWTLTSTASNPYLLVCGIQELSSSTWRHHVWHARWAGGRRVCLVTARGDTPAVTAAAAARAAAVCAALTPSQPPRRRLECLPVAPLCLFFLCVSFRKEELLRQLYEPAACCSAPDCRGCPRQSSNRDVKQVALPHLPLDMLLTKRGAEKWQRYFGHCFNHFFMLMYGRHSRKKLP